MQFQSAVFKYMYIIICNHDNKTTRKRDVDDRFYDDFFCDRSASLAHVNAMLREQLDQATAANQSLTSDIHKLTQDWQAAREELDIKEREWRDEEQVCRLNECDIWFIVSSSAYYDSRINGTCTLAKNMYIAL